MDNRFEVYMAVMIDLVIYWTMMPWSLAVATSALGKGTAPVFRIFYPEDGDSYVPYKVGVHLTDYMITQPRRSHYKSYRELLPPNKSNIRFIL
jgi:hypothetical protein